MKSNKFLRTTGIILTVLVLIVLIGPFLIPVPPLENTVPVEQLVDADSKFVEVNGVNVHYKTWGEGAPTFVLLHGFGASVFSWHEVVEPLAQYGTVIAYDRPAFGLTERPLEWEGESPYGPQAQVDIVIGLMDALKVEKATLVGNSAGGTVSMQVALQYPERVDATRPNLCGALPRLCARQSRPRQDQQPGWKTQLPRHGRGCVRLHQRVRT